MDHGMEPSEIAVRTAQDGDTAVLVRIMDDATRYKVERADVAWGREPDSTARVSAAIARGEMYLVSWAGEDVATASLQWDDAHYWGAQPPVAGYLHGLAVRSGFHGMGLGGRIIDWALQQVAARDRRWLRLDCAAGNRGLCSYYEQQGFARAGERVFPSGHVAALYQRGVEACSIAV